MMYMQRGLGHLRVHADLLALQVLEVLGDLMDLLAERGQIPIRRTLGFTAGRI